MVDVASEIDLPDDFLRELGRLVTRFNRLGAAVIRVLDERSDSSTTMTNQVARRAKLGSLVRKVPNKNDECDNSLVLDADAFIETFNALQVVVVEFKNWEWTIPTALFGARLENWPPTEPEDPRPKALRSESFIERFDSASNDSVHPRQQAGTPVSIEEVRNLSELCVCLYQQLRWVSQKEPSEYRAG